MEKQQENSKKNQMCLWSKRTSIETIENEVPSVECEMGTQNILKYHFVVGILKPGQKRIGLIAINKNKLSIGGVLGIKKFKK